MTIVMTNIKRILRDRSNLLVIIVMPMIFITFSLYALGGNQVLKVGIIDEDKTKLTQYIAERISKDYPLETVKKNEIQEALINDKVGYIIQIDKGFTAGIINGNAAALKTYKIKETNMTVPLRFYLESLTNSIKTIGNAAKKDEGSFYKGLEYYKSGSFSTEYKYVEDVGRKRERTRESIGFVVMFMLYLSINASAMMLEDKELKLYSRILATPVSIRRYMLENFISYFAVMLLQIVLIMGIMLGVFKLDFGPSVLNMFLLFVVFAITSVSFGVMINSISRDTRQSGALTTIIVIPLCMIGGCFWPRDIMPKILQQLSYFDPVNWVLNAIEKLLGGKPLSSIASEIAILLLFSLAFFLISSTGKREIRNN